MNSCYFFCSLSKKKFNHDESKSICNNNLVGVSDQKEAIFLEFIVFSENYLKRELNDMKNLSRKIEKIILPIGFFLEFTEIKKLILF